MSIYTRSTKIPIVVGTLGYKLWNKALGLPYSPLTPEEEKKVKELTIAKSRRTGFSNIPYNRNNDNEEE